MKLVQRPATDVKRVEDDFFDCGGFSTCILR